MNGEVSNRIRKTINIRRIKIRMKRKHINITIIHCYALTNDSEEESKGACYDQLHDELEGTPYHEMRIVMGKEGCGIMNNNGDRLLEFCTICSSEGHSCHTMKSISSPGAPQTEETRTRSTT